MRFTKVRLDIISNIKNNEWYLEMTKIKFAAWWNAQYSNN